jgi:hypothetical protein
MYVQNLKCIKNHPYVSKIGLVQKELRDLLLRESGFHVHYINSDAISKIIGGSEADTILKEMSITIQSGFGRPGTHSPITKSYRSFIYGNQLRARVYFEVSEVQDEYDRMVLEGRSNGYFHRRRGGLNRTNVVRVMKAIHSNGDEISLDRLMELSDVHYQKKDFERNVLKPMVIFGQIKTDGSVVRLAKESEQIWNDETVGIWEQLKSELFYSRMLYLNSRHIEQIEKSVGH